MQIIVPLAEARALRTAMRDSVREMMIREALRSFSRFVLQSQTVHSTSLARLVHFAAEMDRGANFDLSIVISARIRASLGSDVETRLRSVVNVHLSQSFRGPRAPRRGNAQLLKYVVDPTDSESVTHDYEMAEHSVHLLESEWKDLRSRMEAWLKLHGLMAWGEFRFSKPRERWKAQAADLGRIIPRDTTAQIAFPHRLWLAFGEQELSSLLAAGSRRRHQYFVGFPALWPSGPWQWNHGTGTKMVMTAICRRARSSLHPAPAP